MVRRTELKEELRRVLEVNNLSLNEDELGKIIELITKLKVPKRHDVLKNFLSAYLRVYHGLSAREADRISSSSKGRRKWEKKIIQTICSVSGGAVE